MTGDLKATSSEQERDYLFRHRIKDSRVKAGGTITGYVLDGPGLESPYGERIFAPTQTDPGAYPDSCLRASRVMPLHPFWYFMACSRVKFNFVSLSYILSALNIKVFSLFNLNLYVSCIMFQCVDKPTRCNTSYE